MQRTRILVVLMAAATASAFPPLHAQERLELVTYTAPGIVFEEVDIGLNRFGEIRNVSSFPVSPTRSHWVALAGARYLVAASGTTNGLVVFDRRSRRLVGTVPLPFYAHGLFADPIRPRLFVYQTPPFILSRIGVFDAATLTFREFPAPMAFVSGMTYAAKADLLFLHEYRFHEPVSISVYDVATGLRVRRLPHGLYGPMVVDARGERLYASAYLDGSLSRRGLVVIDAVTGAELARVPIESYAFAFDEPRGWLLVDKHLQGRVAVLDGQTLGTLIDVRIDPLPGQEPGLSRFFSPIVGQGRIGAYLLRATNGSPAPDRGYCYEINLEVFDPDGTRRATADLLAPLGTIPFCSYFAVVLRAPPPPHALAAAVDGRRVTLTWENPGDVSEFEIEVGLAPGARGVTQRVGLITAVSAESVPPGVYYVRVKATNEVGTSPASNEIQVVVP